MDEDHKALERALKRIEKLQAQLRAARPRHVLFDVALDLMCVADTNGYFKELSPSWSTTLGWSIEELTAVPFIEFVHPDDRESTDGVAKSLYSGTNVVAFQNRYRHKDGSYRWLMWNAVLEPQTITVLAVAHDMTEFVATRQALKASENAYRMLFNGMLDGFSFHDIILDDDGRPVDYRFKAINPAFEEMTGLSARDLVGRRVLDVLPGTEKHWIEVFGRVALTGEPIRYENYSQEFDKWFEVLAFRPGPGQFACTFHDITVRRQAETERAQLQAQVEHAQKLESLGMMAGGIAHDFNNLLTAIVSSIDLAVADVDTDAEAAKRELATATMAADRAAELCKQMLTYAGRAEPQKESAQLSDLAREILPLAAPSLSKKLSVDARYSPEPLCVVADHAQIRQVILNLVLNAGDAIGDNEGTITIRTGSRTLSESDLSSFRDGASLEAGRYAFIEVEDTGLGMSAETAARIFEPFFTTKFSGRGLGLAATLGIVRAHRGGISVVSTPGVGTKFVVVVPLAPWHTPSTNPKPIDEQPWTGSGTVLLCDDESTVRRVMARLLNSLGFDVLEASDGQQALEFFRSRPNEFSAILLDLTMPKMGGFDVLPLLKERRDNVPVILMSGYDEQRLADFDAMTNVTFLPKPFRKAGLRRALRQVLNASH